jgi:arsenite transporter
LIHEVLAAASRHARLVLVAGLAAGIALPSLALAMRPWIGAMVAGLLFLAALRVGPRQALGAVGEARTAAMLALVFQVGLPLAAIAVIALGGWTGAALATFFVLMLAAPPVSGSPNLTLMTGNDPAPALRQLVIGTALLPLTVVPVFWLTPQFGDPGAVFSAAAGLLALIVVACGAAFALRTTVMKAPSERALRSVDGLSAIAMGVVVIGLMSAVGPALGEAPLEVAAILAVVCLANFAIQVAVATLARRRGRRETAPALGIVAGNRNIALFLTVLPAETVDPILLLIGCYQIPMYVTPAVLGRFYARPANGQAY